MQVKRHVDNNHFATEEKSHLNEERRLIVQELLPGFSSHELRQHDGHHLIAAGRIVNFVHVVHQWLDD